MEVGGEEQGREDFADASQPAEGGGDAQAGARDRGRSPGGDESGALPPHSAEDGLRQLSPQLQEEEGGRLA